MELILVAVKTSAKHTDYVKITKLEISFQKVQDWPMSISKNYKSVLGFYKRKKSSCSSISCSNAKSAIGFDDYEMGHVNPEIEPPRVIHMVPHVPWQQQNLWLPCAMQQEATKHVRKKLENGQLELSQGPYWTRYFLVEKKANGSYWMIKDVQPLNKVTIHDAGIPPSIDEFSEDFVGYPIITAIHYYSGYNQITLDKRSRDYTVFLSEFGFVRSITLPQGWCNSIASFQRVVRKVHCKQIPHHVRLFIDDAGIKGPRSWYNDE